MTYTQTLMRDFAAAVNTQLPSDSPFSNHVLAEIEDPKDAKSYILCKVETLNEEVALNSSYSVTATVTALVDPVQLAQVADPAAYMRSHFAAAMQAVARACRAYEAADHASYVVYSCRVDPSSVAVVDDGLTLSASLKLIVQF